MKATNNNQGRILSLMSVEYQALRDQIVEQVRGIYIIFTALATVIAAAFTAGALTWEKAVVSTSIFNIAIPFILLVAGVGILFALRDMMTIGKYVKNEVEDKVEALLGHEFREWLTDRDYCTSKLPTAKILGWEGWLRGERKGSHLLVHGNILSFVCVFGFLFAVTICLGELRVFHNVGWETIPCTVREVLRYIPLGALLITTGLTYFMYRSLKRL